LTDIRRTAIIMLAEKIGICKVYKDSNTRTKDYLEILAKIK